MRVEVVYALARKATRIELELAEGATVAEALERARLLPLGSELPQECGPVSVWGKVVNPDHPLREDDRMELLRPLVQSPFEWRRQRLGRGVDQGSSASEGC